jgi:protein-tyrosine phosphatase
MGNGIGAVVTVLEEKEYSQHKVAWKMEKHGLRHLWIEARDSEEVALDKHFGATSAFIRQQLEECNVLVHCQMGKSRSASVVIAFLIQYLSISA